MKKSQSLLEYIIGLLIFVIIILLFKSLFTNKTAIIQGATTGVEVETGEVRVNGMTDWQDEDD